MFSPGTILTGAAYAAYAAFWLRVATHVLSWRRAFRREAWQPAAARSWTAYARTAGDILFFGRLLRVNAALWLGEWLFHVCFALVLLRHLRYFLNPVPEWVWAVQSVGIAAGYILPFTLLYILLMRLVFKHEKYAAPANVALLVLVLVIGSLGVVMNAWRKPDLVDVKLFAVGLATFAPAPAPDSALFRAHFLLVLILVPLLPTHIFTAPLVMLEARKRERALHGVMHEGEQKRAPLKGRKSG